MAEALAEAGATVYCLDLPIVPDKAFHVAQAYVSKLGLAGNARLEYRSVNVADQKAIWDVIEIIAEKEGRLDVCIAAAGVLVAEPCLEHSKEGCQRQFKVNVDGVFYSAQAAGGQMTKFRVPGSIILITSVSEHLINRNRSSTAYNTSKAAILQMGRSLACELGPKNIRVNTVSLGYINTPTTEKTTEAQQQTWDQCSSETPLGSMGKPNGLRGVAVWLASDASAFCTGSDIMVTSGTQV
ncbi:NAD-binding protein [Fomitiporia mediterranea MF3/22]|uniref:NAD-binding protein n=1 Tax=Fomitiporia mediterranea (strain MF3/22) TaxID=694068 RepID=UPI0004407547|nr:NAD-binding protein [Fomitiporia mediterranea MF3/22]EJC99851.1 NAD-binding protein [Fomitiporia mediterranea MF3/22]